MRSCYIHLLLALISSVCCTDCPDKWVAFQGSCYLFGHNSVHYTEAQHYCMQHHGRLVEVESQLENAFLKDFISDVPSLDYWLGMTDEFIEGYWRWASNDEPIRFDNWAPGEPDSKYNDEDCAVFHHLLHHAWADVQCATNRRALCEMRPSSGVVIG